MGADGFIAFLDPLTYIASLRYFVWDDWRWPLSRAAGLGGEAGTNIVFTDAIPIYALVLRVFRRAIDPDFNFLGVWLGLCYALQGTCAVAAVRLWGVPRWLPTLSAAAIAVSMPAWIGRLGHAALSFHAILLLSIGIYGWAERAQDARRPVVASLLLCWIAVSINLYLFLMSAALFAALLLRLWRRGFAPSRLALAGALLAGGATLEMWVLGFFEPHGVAAGFGVYSMNLLSPVYPAQSTLLHRYFAELDPTGGQNEGFNYLGLGLIGLGLVAAWLARDRWRSIVSRHWPLAVIATGLTAWSLSNRVYCGRTLLVELPAPPDVLAQFRAPGRFFWPVAYLVLIGAVVLVARRPRRLGWLLVAFASLQWFDAARLRQGARVAVASVPTPAFDRVGWLPLLAAHRRIVVAPTWECVSVPGDHRRIAELVYLSAIPRTPVTTVYSARPLVVDCEAEAAVFRSGGGIEVGDLVVALESAGTEFLQRLPAGSRCVRFSNGRACSTLEAAGDLLLAVGRVERRFGGPQGVGFGDGFESGDTRGWSKARP